MDMYNPYGGYQMRPTAYQQAFGQTYQQPPYQFQNNPFQAAPMPLKATITKVQGREGVDKISLAPSSSILLVDETAPIIWLKSTDANGMVEVSGYQIQKMEEEKPVDYKSLEDRIAKLEEAQDAKSVVTKPEFKGGKSNNSRNERGTDSQ